MSEPTQHPKTLPETILHNFLGLSLPQRVGILAVLALGLAAIPVLMLMGRDPDMAVLFSKLEPEDVQAISVELDRSMIPFTVSASGDTIKVPQEQVDGLRLKLAQQGLPEASGVGFEIFDQVGLGVTHFVQQINFRRALQGELARTISQIGGVRRARVHLVIPEQRLFASAQQQARAAIVLTLKRGAVLAGAQVKGITHLVASSVEGLDASQVTVVDHHGKVLSDEGKRGSAQLNASQLEMQRKVEKDLEQRVQSMLDTVLGVNKSVIRVSAPLDFRKMEVTEETFDPDSQVVRSEQRSQEKVTEEVPQSGVPGSRSNVPSEAPPEGANGPKQAKRKNETLNYELNRKVSKIVEPTGSIKRLSVAVLVDGTYEPAEGKDVKEGSTHYVPRTEEEIQHLVQIVKKAVGFSEKRGDQIEVVNTPFDTPSVSEGDETAGNAVEAFLHTWGGAIKPAVFLLLGLLVLLMVVRPVVTRLTVLPPEPFGEHPKGLPATVEDYEAQISISPEEEAIKLAGENPSTAAFVIRSWIKEEQTSRAENV